MSITKTEPMSEEAYRRFALGDPQGQWELYRGQLREKPGMSVEHGDVMDAPGRRCSTINSTETSFVSEPTMRACGDPLDTYYVPDIAVIPTAVVQALRERPGSLDAYPIRYPWSSRFGRPRRAV